MCLVGGGAMETAAAAAMLEAGVGRFSRAPALAAALLAEMWAPLAVALAALATLPSLLRRLQVIVLRLRSRGKEVIQSHIGTYYSSGDEEDGDEEEHYDDEGSVGEWGEEDEAVAAKKPSGKTEEEKVAEAAEIGYKVVGPLGADEKPFKPYEPVFAVVQVCSTWPQSFEF